MQTIRLTIASILICVVAYTLAVFGIARLANPTGADGSLLKNPKGEIIGSSLIAQSFTSPRYIHPRPSAVEYNASGAGGSNLSPKNPAITSRAEAIISSEKATSENPIPADLVTASGSGLDPHITEAAAYFQAPRIATARNIPLESVRKAIAQTKQPLIGKLGGPYLVNVLKLNLQLDKQ